MKRLSLPAVLLVLGSSGIVALPSETAPRGMLADPRHHRPTPAPALTGLARELADAFPALAERLGSSGDVTCASQTVDGRTVLGLAAKGRPEPVLGVVPEQEGSLAQGHWDTEGTRPFQAFFPSQYDDAFVVEGRGVRVVVRPLDARNGVGQAEGGGVAYRGAYRSTDSLHVVQGDRTEELLYLRDPGAPTRFEYEIVEMAGVEQVYLHEGRVKFVDGKGRGIEIGRPWVMDARGSRSEVAARWRLSSAPESGPRQITLELDASSLVYPLIIDPSWSMTGSMNEPRARHPATLLPNGKVLVAGRSDAGAELYDPAAGVWSATGSMAEGRSFPTGTLLTNGKVLVAGGGTSGRVLSSAELYDPSLGTWSVTGSLAEARHAQTATLLPNGKVLVAGGETWNYSTIFASAESYDPSTGAWSANGIMAQGRSYHTATLLPSGKVLVAGGLSTGSMSLASAESYDPASGAWSTTGSMAVPRSSHTATLLPSGKVLVTGGSGSGGYRASAELYDPASGTWSTTESMAEARMWHTATLLTNGKVLVTGGMGSGVLTSAELYDPATGAWSTTGSMAEARIWHTATLLSNAAVLVAGGDGGVSGTLASAELYDPSACAPIAVSPASLPDGSVGTPYSQTITATGGTAPYTYSVTSGALPAGLTLSAAGVLSGTPAVAGASSFTITATDATACTGFAAYTLMVCGVSLSPASLPAGTVGTPYSQTITATGGTAPYTFSVTAGALPIGLSLAPAGVLSGTPALAATFGFTVTAAETGACAGSKSYALTITGAAGPSDNILAGQGLGDPSPNRVVLLRQNGTSAGVDFLAYGAGHWGVNVADSNITGGTRDQILTGPGPGAVFGPQVRSFQRDGSPMAKVNFFAYGTLKYGVNAGGGDVDGDGFDEALSGAGPGAVFGPHVRGWNFDNVSISSMAKINFFAYSTLKYGVNVAAGLLDSDAYEELLTGPGPGAVFGTQVRGWNYDAATLTSMGKVNYVAFSGLWYGAFVGAGDVDADGFDEIATTPGPGSANPTRFVGHNFDGASVTSLPGFDVTPVSTAYGGRLGLGDVNGDGLEDLVAGGGRTSAADSTVRPYVYVGGALIPLLSFNPFSGGTYGVSVDGGNYGY